jgi:hypothetical protein
MRIHRGYTDLPQVVPKNVLGLVNKLWINSLLQSSNDQSEAFLGLYGWGNLPTMKSQLSQLP